MFLLMLLGAVALALALGLALDAPALFDVKATQELHAKALGDLETAIGELEAAEKSGDQAKITAAKTKCDTLERDVNALQGKCERARKLSGYRQANQQMGELAQVTNATKPGEIQGKAIPQDSPAATAKDHAAEEAELEGHFVALLQGKEDIPAGAMGQFHPKNAAVQGRARFCYALPPSMARRVMPEAFVGPMGAKALPTTSVSAPGNQLIAPQYRTDVIQYDAEPPRLFPLCTQLPAQSGKIIWFRLNQGAGSNEHGGIAVGWTAEGGEKGETEAKFNQMTIDCHEVSGYTKLSRKLLSRSPADITGILNRLFRTALLSAIDNAIITGDGEGKPLGILRAAGLGNRNRAEANKIGRADIVGVKYAVPITIREQGVYCIADSAAEFLETLENELGLQKFPEVAAGQLNGRALISTTRMPALGTKGDLLFGNPKQIIAGVEQEIVIVSSEHYDFRAQNIAFVALATMGSAVAIPQAFATLDVPAQQQG